MTQEIKILLAIFGVTAILTVGGVFFLGKSSANTSTNKVDASVLGALTSNDDHKIGSDSAKVTIVEFSDLECPACAAAQPLVQKILDEYKGRIRFVYRHFPLPQHTKALTAINAAESAGEQGKFWEMHDKLFATQDQWSGKDNAQNLIIGYAQELGLDTEKFKVDMNGGKYDAKIEKDKNDGLTLKVNSTPTFFINDQKYSGPLSYENFKSQIDAEINK